MWNKREDIHDINFLKAYYLARLKWQVLQLIFFPIAHSVVLCNILPVGNKIKHIFSEPFIWTFKSEKESFKKCLIVFTMSLKIKPAAQAAGADPSWCDSTNR